MELPDKLKRLRAVYGPGADHAGDPNVMEALELLENSMNALETLYDAEWGFVPPELEGLATVEFIAPYLKDFKNWGKHGND